MSQSCRVVLLEVESVIHPDAGGPLAVVHFVLFFSVVVSLMM